MDKSPAFQTCSCFGSTSGTKLSGRRQGRVRGDALGPGSGTPAPDMHLPSRGCFRSALSGRTHWPQTSVQWRRTWSFGSFPVSPGFVHLCGASTPKSLTLWDVSAANALCLPKKGAGDRHGPSEAITRPAGSGKGGCEKCACGRQSWRGPPQVAAGPRWAAVGDACGP